MKKILGVTLFCLSVAASSAMAQRDYCFQNAGLKVKQTVSFTLTGNKIEGTLESGGYDKDTSAETFAFTGLVRGSLLTVKFDGTPPYELPPGTKNIVWTLGTKALGVPMYGKNYNSGKYSTYTATFKRCKGDI